jgi:type I restriction enzyme S subunit
MPMLERPISKAGWTRVAFGDVVRLSKARVADPEAAGIERVVGLEHIEPGDLRIRRWGDVADGTTFTTLFKPGQVLFGKRRAYQRKVAVADFEGVCSGDIYVLEPANDRLMPELLPFLCQTDAFFDHAVGTSAGSLSPRTNWTSLASFEFLLPPIQEQARLVEALSAHRTLYEKLNETIRTSQTLREAAFSSAISDATIDREEIGKLARFSSGKLIRVSDLPKSRSMSFPYPVVGGNGIAGFSDQPLKEVPSPCIAIGRVGEYCGAVHFIDEACWVTDNALFVKSHTDRLKPRYFELCLQNLHLNRHATGGAQPLMTQSIINRFKIPVPTVTKQREIISADLAITANLDGVIQRLTSVHELGRKLLIQCIET